MRFLVEISDLRSPLRHKYGRVVQSILAEADKFPHQSVMLTADRLTSAVPLEDKPGFLWWQKLPRARPPGLAVWGFAFNVLSAFFYTRLFKTLRSSELTDGWAWNLANSIEVFSPLWRRRLADFLKLDSNIKRLAFFHYWLAERGLTFDRSLSPATTCAANLSPSANDVLILAGASWRHDFRALEQLKQAHGFRLVCLVYDLLPMDYPSVVTARQRELYKKFLGDIGRIADVIIADKDTSARLKLFYQGHGGSTAHLSAVSLRNVALAKAAGKESQRLQAFGLTPKSFMLCVSSLRERKHILWLYGLCAKLRQERANLPLLVIAGAVADSKILEILAFDPAWDETARFIEDPSDTELAWLYENARLCLQPSFEGGGEFAVMEALNYGQHCIAADTPALEEASEVRAQHFPRDETLWSKAILQQLDQPDRAAPQIVEAAASAPGILLQIAELLKTEADPLNIKTQAPAGA